MSHWTLIGIAAIANVLLNLCLKQLGQSLKIGSTRELFVSVLLSPWIWLSVTSAAVLLGAFVAAVRVYSLSLTYTAVTALAMVALTLVSVALRYETISASRAAGLALIVAGLVLSGRD